MSGRAAIRAAMRVLLLVLVWLACLPARADTGISLLQSFRGTVNFVGTEQTLRTGDNNNACKLVSSSTDVTAKLSGIPSGAKVLSAQLYWAGSGSDPDYNVTFDGVAVTAGRQFTSGTIGNGYNYFSGAADVTTQVSKKGNGNYSFSGLTVSTGYPWCNSQGVLGGFSLVVVYSHASEPFRMLNVYEGFKYFQNNGFRIDLGSFNVPSLESSKVTGRVGHITWEGDSTLSQGGESLYFNRTELTDPMNPSGNQFNSASNATGDTASYGIDFDIYTLKSPTITAGQNTASTTYISGQDMVLLSAEIVAMPYVANADLALTMTRSGELRVGSTAYYTIGVTNEGIDAEMGPVKVVDTLPAGLKLVSTSGSGWKCTDAPGANGTTVVTCLQDGPVDPGARMSSLTLTVTPDAAGTYNNTATVSGVTGDNNSGNNSASNSSSAVDGGSVSVVFTTEVCKNGDPIVTAPGDVGCHRFTGPIVAGSNTSKVYLTQVSGANKAGAISNSDTTVTVDLRASCLPNKNGLTVAYAGLTLDCKGNWQSLKVTVPGGKPTATLPDAWTLQYNDVGRISLSLRYQSFVLGTVNIISRPYDLRVRDVLRASDSVADLKGGTADGFAKDGSKAFAKAGEPFILRLGALMANGAWAPSFGLEPSALKGLLADDLVKLDFSLDLFAANPLVSPVKPLAIADVEVERIAREAFVLDKGFTLNTTDNLDGAIDAKARWFEAGYLAVTPILADYLGTGQVGGPPGGVDPAAKERLVGGTRVIGHFYPDHLETAIDTGFFGCAASMNCPLASTDPAKPAYPLTGAIYSTQPFKFTITAFGLPKEDANGTPQAQLLSLFRNLAGSSANGNVVGSTTYRNVTLSKVAKPTDATGAASALKGAFATVPANSFPVSANLADVKAMKAVGAYTLAGALFDPAKRGVQPSAPEMFYLRASMKERLVTGATTTRDIEVGSATPVDTPALQYEKGLMVVSGRLLVPNVFGSELLRVPLALTAQYWNGTAWVTSATDDTSTVATALVPVKCTGTFAANCNANVLTLTSGNSGVRLDKGVGKLILQSPGRGKVGSVDFTLGSSTAPWLPSTQARATFGLARSSLIYLREVY